MGLSGWLICFLGHLTNAALKLHGSSLSEDDIPGHSVFMPQ